MNKSGIFPKIFCAKIEEILFKIQLFAQKSCMIFEKKLCYNTCERVIAECFQSNRKLFYYFAFR